MTNVTNDKLQNHIDSIIFCQMATFFNGKKVNNFGKNVLRVFEIIKCKNTLENGRFSPKSVTKSNSKKRDTNNHKLTFR